MEGTICVAVLSIFLVTTAGDINYFQRDVQQLLPIQEKYLEVLSTYVDTQVQHLAKIEHFLSTFSELLKIARTNQVAFTNSSFCKFVLIKRLTRNVEDLRRLVSPHEHQKTIDTYLKSVKAIQLPPKYYYEIVATTLVWYHATQVKHDEDDIPYFSETLPTAVPLAFNDYFDLAMRAYRISHHRGVIHWMKRALQKLDLKDDRYVQNKTVCLEYLAYSYSMEGEVEESLDAYREIAKLSPHKIRTEQDIARLERIIASGEEVEIPVDTLNDVYYNRYTDHLQVFKRMCQGEEFMTESEKSELSCYYETNGHPYLFLQPAKVEELSLDPALIMFHGVISEREMLEIRDLASRRFSFAMVRDIISFDTRINKVAWISDREDALSVRLSRRFHYLTGLSLDYSEDIQIAHYGLGGLYRLHPDFFTEDARSPTEAVLGNRIATLLAYIDDVEEGGYTVFPNIGAIVRPYKGSAVFWYNLHRNGSEDYDTVHAACPVTAGTKWILTKWFREFGHPFVRPCSLNKME